VQIFKTNDPVVPNLHFRAHPSYDTGWICRKGAGVGRGTVEVQSGKAVAGSCATDTERPIEVIHVRSDDAETSTNAPQRIYAAVEGRMVLPAHRRIGAGVAVIEGIPVAFKTPEELTGLQLTSPLEATDETLGRELVGKLELARIDIVEAE